MDAKASIDPNLRQHEEGDGKDCDEYPFISTMEGGPGASLRLVPEGQNRSEGASLKIMYRDAKCDMATDPSASGATQYLVIPLAVEPETEDDPYGGPRTFHVCGSQKEMAGGGLSAS